MLSREDLDQIAAIFGDALELAPADRQTLIVERCAGRDDWRREIESLLAAHERTGSFLEPGELNAAAVMTPTPAPALVGAWRLLERIGSGGMGDVYLAERADGAFDGRAAIKFMRAHLPGVDAARRFRAERQALASLRHANIVTLLDGGTTANGQGYLVMEYVAGDDLMRHCERHALSLNARLALVREVCTAVQYAHQRSIVHRDLKPANILVSADGVPKILDFGLAKLLEVSVEDGNVTSPGAPGPLTLNYASPEQLRGLPVTTACDVYSLGVLLYEVLAGRRPYDTTGVTLDVAFRMVIESEPLRPSAAPSGAMRPYSPSQLRGDLDAIVSKAMRKEPEDRYGSAGELADDLARVIAREPVVARAPSMGYVLRRVAERHRLAVGIAAVALLATVTALGVAVWQQRVALSAQQQSDRRFREVRQLANALIFKLHDSVAKLPGSTPVRREIVDSALGYLERLQQESDGDATLQLELAGAYQQIGAILGDPQFPNLGDRAGAIAQVMKARALLQPLADSAEPTESALVAIVDADRFLARVSGEADERLRYSEEAVRYAERAAERSFPKAREMLARALFALSGSVQPPEAKIPYWQRTGRLFEELLVEDPADPVRQRNVALVGRNLGGLLASLQRHQEARPHLERALALDTQRLAAAPDNRSAKLDTAIDYSQVATLHEQLGDRAEALSLLKKSAAIRQALAESDPDDVLTRGLLGSLRERIAILELKNGNAAEARALARNAVSDLESVAGKTKAARDLDALNSARRTLRDAERISPTRPQ
jgi:non-specific serine/threonine protein kinase/serine/threonine-protein kinase